MLMVHKNKSVGYKSGTEANDAAKRLGAGSVKEGTTGTWYHEIPFSCPTLEKGKLNEDLSAIALHLRVSEDDVLKALNNGVYLLARMKVEDGADPAITASKTRAAVELEMLQAINTALASADLPSVQAIMSLTSDMAKEGATGGVKAKNAWLDAFIASDEYKNGSWKKAA